MIDEVPERRLLFRLIIPGLGSLKLILELLGTENLLTALNERILSGANNMEDSIPGLVRCPWNPLYL
jgi:hypothetical protein